MTKDAEIMKIMLNDTQDKRGKYITNFAHIESLITGIIASNYVTDTTERQRFTDQILDDQYFSFEFKKKLLQMILKQTHSANYAVLKRHLETIQRYRNIMAHALLIFDGDKHNATMENIKFKHGGKCYIASVLMQKYEELANATTELITKEFNITLTIFE